MVPTICFIGDRLNGKENSPKRKGKWMWNNECKRVYGIINWASPFISGNAFRGGFRSLVTPIIAPSPLPSTHSELALHGVYLFLITISAVVFQFMTSCCLLPRGVQNLLLLRFFYVRSFFFILKIWNWYN